MRSSIKDFCNSKPVVEYTENHRRYIGIADLIIVSSASSDETISRLDVHFGWIVEIRPKAQVGLSVSLSKEPVFETFLKNHSVEFFNPMVTEEGDMLRLTCSDHKMLSITHLGEEKVFAQRILHDYEEATHH